MKNKKHNVEIEVLTPVHIGNGKTLSGIDYFCYQEQLRFGDDKHKGKYKSFDKFEKVYKSKLYKYKITDLIEILDEEDKNELIEKINDGNIIEIRNKIFYFLKDKQTEEYKEWLNVEIKKEEDDKNDNIKYNRPDYKDKRYEDGKYKNKFLEIAEKPIVISNEFFNNFITKISGGGKQIKGKTELKQKNENKNQVSQIYIQEYIKGLNGYYIPGSSLKGAIRTVLTNENIENIKPENSPFKKLIIRDSEQIKDGLEIGLLGRKSKKSTNDDGDIKGDGGYAEFLKEKTILNTQIIFKSFLIDSNNFDITKDIIIEKSKEYYKMKLNDYIKELEKFQVNFNDKDDKYKKIKNTIQSFRNILQKINTLGNNECIINIGFGGGFWFKSYHGVKNIHKDNDKFKLEIPSTNYYTNLQDGSIENLGFIKLTFKN